MSTYSFIPETELEALHGGGVMRERLIIDNRTDLPMNDAIAYAWAVVSGGRTSEVVRGGKRRKTYCWLSTWKDGIRVATFVNKASERLVVYREKG